MKKFERRILLVEDNADHAVLIRGILSKFPEVGLISIAKDGEDAVKIMNAAIADKYFPDLVLLDIKLPKISGLELLKVFKGDNKTRNIPIIVLSTSDIDKDRKAALSLGANHYIVKPSNFDRLYDRLEAIFAELFQETDI